MNIAHKTIKIKKTIKAPVEKVFKALSSVREKTKWSAPGGDEIKFLKSEFKFGGIETFKCGPKGQLDFNGVLHYEDIIRNQRIVYTETVFYKKDKLASALVSTELFSHKESTQVVMTIHVASYCGEQMLKGYENGHKAALTNLKSHLE